MLVSSGLWGGPLWNGRKVAPNKKTSKKHYFPGFAENEKVLKSKVFRGKKKHMVLLKMVFLSFPRFGKNWKVRNLKATCVVEHRYDPGKLKLQSDEHCPAGTFCVRKWEQLSEDLTSNILNVFRFCVFHDHLLCFWRLASVSSIFFLCSCVCAAMSNSSFDDPLDTSMCHSRMPSRRGFQLHRCASAQSTRRWAQVHLPQCLKRQQQQRTSWMPFDLFRDHWNWI